MDAQTKSAILTGAKMAIAASIVYCIYLIWQWPYGFWAVVTVAAVTRPGLTDTLSKIITRLSGTLIGAFLAYIILMLTHDHTAIMALLFFIIIIFSSYIGLQKTVLSYGGIIIGLTLTIVISSGLLNSAFLATAFYRAIDVLLGVICIAGVNIFLRLFFPKKEMIKQNLKSQFAEAFHQLWAARKYNKQRIKTAIHIAATATITFLPWLYWRYPGGFWATISCFFIMEESMMRVLRKGWLRFFSHIVAALIGGVSALLIDKDTVWILIPLLASFFLFGYMMVCSTSLSNAANTMGIALAVMLLADSGTLTPNKLIIERFLNVVGGIGVGILMTYFLQKLDRRAIEN